MVERNVRGSVEVCGSWNYGVTTAIAVGILSVHPRTHGGRERVWLLAVGWVWVVLFSAQNNDDVGLKKKQ